MGEQRIWEGRSSSIVLVGSFVKSALFFWLPALVLLFVVWTRPELIPESTAPRKLLFPAALVWGALPVPAVFWKWLVLKCRKYEVTSERLRLYTGVLSRRVDELELYRVKDLAMVQPFFLRVFGKGNVVLASSDRTTPQLVLEAVDDPRAVVDRIRAQVETERDRKRVKEVDME